MLTRGKERGRINWEIGTDIYTLLYIKQITNKDLLNSTGNSTQYSVMTYIGKESKKEWIYVYTSIYLIHFAAQQKLTHYKSTILQKELPWWLRFTLLHSRSYHIINQLYSKKSFLGGSDGKESTCNAVDSISGLGRSPGERSGNPLQYSCLENPHGQRSLVGYSPWGHKESDMLSNSAHALKNFALNSSIELN